MKKIYIAGCGGMLGEAFYKQFYGEYELKCTDIDVNDAWLEYLDFRDLDAYRKDVLEFKPDYLWVNRNWCGKMTLFLPFFSCFTSGYAKIKKCHFFTLNTIVKILIS